MSARAAEMAKIMMEQWPESESPESFVLRMFPNDTLADLEKAAAIFAELEETDSISEEWFGEGRGQSRS